MSHIEQSLPVTWFGGPLFSHFRVFTQSLAQPDRRNTSYFI